MGPPEAISSTGTRMWPTTVFDGGARPQPNTSSIERIVSHVPETKTGPRDNLFIAKPRGGRAVGNDCPQRHSAGCDAERFLGAHR